MCQASLFAVGNLILTIDSVGVQADQKCKQSLLYVTGIGSGRVSNSENISQY